MKYYQKDKDAAIDALRSALIKIHDNPHDRDMIVSESYKVLLSTKQTNKRVIE